MFEWTSVAIALPSTVFILYVLSWLHRCLMDSVSYAKVLNCVGAVIELPENEEDIPVTDEPVFILGQQYSSRHQMNELRHDIKSILWFTYRSGFSSIGGSGPTSDRGWGCMLRCGQMVLAQAFIRKHLGRSWRWQADHNGQLPLPYKKVLRLFEDKRTAPYSIHQISHMGESEGKAVGTWFGPNTVAQAIKKLAPYDYWNNIHVHVALDNLVVLSDLKISPWKPLVLFIPLRLGLSELNPLYSRGIKATFRFPQTLGMLGGRPSHALYFLGYVGSQLLYLDPHVTQTMADLDGPDSETFPDSSYHCERVGRIELTDIDPSVSLCFFIDTEAELESWISMAKSLLIHGDVQPLFEIVRERPHFPEPCLEPGVEQHESEPQADEEDFELLS